MASVYKRKQDKAKKKSAWYIGYRDHLGKQRTCKGFTDKKETEKLAAKLEHEKMLRKRGLIDPEQEKQAERRKAPLEGHLDDFEKSLGKTTGKHVKLTMTRIRRIVREAEMHLPADIDVESVEGVLRDMMEGDEIGHKTYNHYVAAMNQFCTWMVPKRLAVNPLQGIEKLNTEVDVRHPRRALEPKEFQKLLKSARESGVLIQCYTGEERARIYTISYMTGLRRKEIASLTPKSFDLEADPPTVTVEAACSKHRRKDVLPLHAEFVPLLIEWIVGEPDEPIFPKLKNRRTWLMVKKDLERVKIPYRTDEGIADFHASGRHTYITELLRNGTSLPEAMKLARHSDVKMTMKYTHIGLNDQHLAVQNLPWECSGSDSETSDSRLMAEGDSKTAPTVNDETPAIDRGCRDLSSPDIGCQGVEAAGLCSLVS
jgi:integrase